MASRTHPSREHVSVAVSFRVAAIPRHRNGAPLNQTVALVFTGAFIIVFAFR